ncbi:MAG: hypothetical protein NTX36_14855 [Proteobacteria bacterium]|nr:hypothetical protein [Pseudomonadota bacterium]
MKIDENKRMALLDSLLKSDSTRAGNSPAADVFLSETKEINNMVELSIKKDAIDRALERLETPPILFKRRDLNFIDKVELSTKKKTNNTVKEKIIITSTITQERIDALLETIRFETYNARVGFVSKNAMKSELLDVRV